MGEGYGVSTELVQHLCVAGEIRRLAPEVGQGTEKLPAVCRLRLTHMSSLL